MKTISRTEFAQLMAKTAYTMPPTKQRKKDSPEDFDDFDYDKKSNEWMKASEVLLNVGEPFAKVAVEDEELEDGYKIVHLRTLKDVPVELSDIIRAASAEMDVRFGKVTS